MTDEYVIRTQGVTRRFGRLIAVDDVDLTVRRGEVFGFLGPNGAGKSTLIRMIVGLLRPSQGSLVVLGQRLPEESERLRADVGYMTQRFSLYEDLTIRENLEFAAEIFGLGRVERQDRVEEVLAEYGLSDRQGQRPATLSGGWKQRLALAAATVHRPSLLVLDEPTAGVDPDSRRRFWEKTFAIAAEGTTVLVSTHYMDEAVRCHRVAMLISGRLVAVGEPDELVRALQGRIVEVEVDNVERVIPVLRRLPQVASVTQLGSLVHVLLARDAGPAPALATHLSDVLTAEGIDRAALHEAEPTLEDVFVALGLGEQLTEDAA